MPELYVSDRVLAVEQGANLLDSLLDAGVALSYSCRAGSCHACLVRCLSGTLADKQPDALSPTQRDQGWRLACQCQVVENTAIEVFDAGRDALPGTLQSCDWLSPNVLRLRLIPSRALRYTAGQHVSLCALDGTIRPYSMASLAGEDPWLEFHIDCHRQGSFARQAKTLRAGDELRIGQIYAGALHYDPQWQNRPLLLIASGTGLAPLYAILREAMRQEHQGSVKLLHVARNADEHYLNNELQQLQSEHGNFQLEQVVEGDLCAALGELRPVPRSSIAMLCGHPERVENFARQLYLAGLPRSQMYAESFLPRA